MATNERLSAGSGTLLVRLPGDPEAAAEEGPRGCTSRRCQRGLATALVAAVPAGLLDVPAGGKLPPFPPSGPALRWVPLGGVALGAALGPPDEGAPRGAPAAPPLPPPCMPPLAAPVRLLPPAAPLPPEPPGAPPLPPRGPPPPGGPPLLAATGLPNWPGKRRASMCSNGVNSPGCSNGGWT